MAAARICVVEGCDKRATGRGFYNVHYQRWLRLGDPLLGKDRQPQPGEAISWLKAHVDFDGEGCLAWPFARFPSGRAKIGVDGKTHYAYRLMCEWRVCIHDTSGGRQAKKTARI